MASIGGFVTGFGASSPSVTSTFGSIAMNGDEYVRCTKCGYGGCDVRVSGCGCTLHARCIPLNPNGCLSFCPQCEKPTQGLVLFPMSFREIDEAHRSAQSVPTAPKNRGRKRKSVPGSESEEKGTYISERRTGRWTNEEMAYCDKLMLKFELGEIPVADGVKLNEFLGNMLKSKQSRLTKKMKNAKLSSKAFKRGSGCLNYAEAREFSDLEECFFQSVTDLQERAEIKFHMQKEWREQFSRVCASIGQPLDADAWLSSVEEMDRRASRAKDAARMARRKLMMGVALRTDSQNPDIGVFIEKSEAEIRGFDPDRDAEEEMLSFLVDDKSQPNSIDLNGKSSLLHSAPFLSKAIAYLQRHGVPFEHIDLWVPSFVPGGDDEQGTTCRLCYAGSATVEKLVGDDGQKRRDITPDEQFNLFAFGDYSQKFSFDVGCGLPGRVYESGRPCWEQSVHNAPHNHFERCGGALQWGIKTVVGIPVASPNVGRIVVTLYSCFDRPKDEDLVTRLSEEFTRLMPSPKWKLVVDIGDVIEEPPLTAGTSAVSSVAAVQDTEPDPLEDRKPAAEGELSVMSVVANSTATVAETKVVFGSVASTVPNMRDRRIDEVVSLLGEYMPSDPSSPLSPYLPGFMSLRLLLLRNSRSPHEEELVRTMLDSYSSYTSGGRNRSDIVVMLARDFIFMSQQQPQPAQHQQPPFLSLGHNMMAPATHVSSNAGLSLFGLPSTSSSLQNSPALTPIPVPGSNDSMSIVSN